MTGSLSLSLSLSLFINTHSLYSDWVYGGRGAQVNSVKVSSPPPMCTSPPPHRRWSPGKHATVEHMEHVDSVLDACVGAALLVRPACPNLTCGVSPPQG